MRRSLGLLVIVLFLILLAAVLRIYGLQTEPAGKNHATAWVECLLFMGAGGVVIVALHYSFRREVMLPLASIQSVIDRLKKEEGLSARNPSRLLDVGSLERQVDGLVGRVRTERLDNDRRIAALDNRHRAILRAFPSPFFLIDSSGTLERVNPAAEQLMIQIGLEDRLPPVVQRLVESVLNHDIDYLPDNPAHAVYLRLGDKEAYYLPRLFRLRDDSGTPYGLAVILVDVTRFRWSDDIKTSQIATVSHEIKTPLTAIRVMLYLLLEKKFGEINPRQDEMLRLACSDCERLLRTLNHLLELSRLEAGAEQIMFARVEPAELVAQAMQANAEAAAERRMRWETDLAPDCPAVLADSGRMEHVLGNFISNALKYSPEGGVVHIRVSRQGSEFVRFSVVDQGPGIAEEYQGRVFERFFRLPGTAREGMGLGLSIAREIVRAHRGRIGVISSPGKGAEFYCDLPTHTKRDAA